MGWTSITPLILTSSEEFHRILPAAICYIYRQGILWLFNFNYRICPWNIFHIWPFKAIHCIWSEFWLIHRYHSLISVSTLRASYGRSYGRLVSVHLGRRQVQPGDFLAICGTAGAAWPFTRMDHRLCFIIICYTLGLKYIYIYILLRYNPFPLLLNGPPPNKHLEEFFVLGGRGYLVLGCEAFPKYKSKNPNTKSYFFYFKID